MAQASVYNDSQQIYTYPLSASGVSRTAIAYALAEVDVLPMVAAVGF